MYHVFSNKLSYVFCLDICCVSKQQEHGSSEEVTTSLVIKISKAKSCSFVILCVIK